MACHEHQMPVKGAFLCKQEEESTQGNTRINVNNNRKKHTVNMSLWLKHVLNN